MGLCILAFFYSVFPILVKVDKTCYDLNVQPNPQNVLNETQSEHEFILWMKLSF